MKILKIIAIVVFLIIQFWIACSLGKIASSINGHKEIRVKSNTSVSGDISIMSHDFTPHWK